jgi:hypothetical protein
MNKGNLIKILGTAATLVSMAATFVAGWVNDVKMDEKIAEKVNEALGKVNEAP